MTTNGSPGVVTELFHGLIDDAGLFPPAALPMGAAVGRFLADREAASPVLSHRLVCPAERLADLREWAPVSGVIPVMVTAPAEVAALHSVVGADLGPHLRVTAIELRPGDSWRNLAFRPPDGTRVFVELSTPALSPDRHSGPGPAADLAAGLGILRRRGWSAKIRCGGATAELVPTPAELAFFIADCVRTGTAFKATAGLHSAVRGADPETGIVQHGFVNVLLAVAAAVGGADLAAITAVLEQTDAEALTSLVRSLDRSAAQRVRELFTSFGSCDTAGPLDQLAVLGLGPGSLSALTDVPNRSAHV